MTECQMITHVIVRGDTLYRLAQKYKTTVPMILLANPGLDPYNLQIGTRLRICKGNQMVEKPAMDEMQMLGDLKNAMLKYVGWLKLYLVSLSQPAARQREVAQKVEQVAGSLVDIFGLFYPKAMTDNFRERFVRGYTLDIMSLANSLNNRDNMAAEQFDERISENAQRVSTLLSQYNRFYSEERLEDALEELEDIIESIVRPAMNGDDRNEFMGFDSMDEWASDLASYLADGLRREYYREG